MESVEIFDEGYMEGWEDAIRFVKSNPSKFGLTKLEE